MNHQSDKEDLRDAKNGLPGIPRLRRWNAWLRMFDLREAWWRLLDLLETRKALRRTLCVVLVTALVLGAARVWVYPMWTKRNAISMARQWIGSGHLEFAAVAVQNAINTAPEKPETWHLAAELARLRGQRSEAVDHARHAAQLDPKSPLYALDWASMALQADMSGEADRALGSLSVEDATRSPYAQRLLGELARQKGQLTAAKNHFESALRLDGPVAIDEVPLGLVLLNATAPSERQRGLDLLEKWTSDESWGATAARTLLADAMARGERPSMLRWAESLRANPRCTMGDMPNCLAALARADEQHFSNALASLEKDHAVTPQAAAQLVGWLNQIGRSADAVAWMNTLPQEGLKHPPLSVVGAEALRQTAAWPELSEWTKKGDWGEVDFLRWAYGMQAARALGDKDQADEFWRTLRAHAAANSVHALFAGDSIFTWGLVAEAETLWWTAADQGGPNATQALGTLARHYQVRRDAEGQYRAFRQLHFLHPQDPNTTNNFVYFAALTKNGGPLIEQLARENLAHDPQNLTYLATRAFVMFMNGQSNDALALLKPRANEAANSPALAFAYGLALAGTGDTAGAQRLLDKLDPALQSDREVELIKRALEPGRN